MTAVEKFVYRIMLSSTAVVFVLNFWKMIECFRLNLPIRWMPF
jgi:hypothetical protein